MGIWHDETGPRPLVIAHRGGALLGPENTTAAIAASLAQGADAVEVDVRLTADGKLVCIHDPDLTRIAGDRRRVEALDHPTLLELCPGIMSLRYALAASAPAGILLDVKTTTPDALPLILDQLGAAKPRVLLGLRTASLVARARSLDPELKILAFSSDPDAVAIARSAGANWFRLWQSDADAARVASVRAAGLRPAIMVGQAGEVPRAGPTSFPVGIIDQAGLSAVLRLGPDAILLDDPRLLKT